VEAEEFIIPLDELPTVKVKLQDGFYEFDDVNGTEVPALRAGFHLHRGVKSYNENKIKYITLDYPHVGCGVKTMQEMREYINSGEGPEPIRKSRCEKCSYENDCFG